MEPDPAAEYLIDAAGEALDGEFQCAIENFCRMPPSSGVEIGNAYAGACGMNSSTREDIGVSYGSACSLEQSELGNMNLAYRDACRLAHTDDRINLDVEASYGPACSFEQTNTDNCMSMMVAYRQSCGPEHTSSTNSLDRGLIYGDTSGLSQTNTRKRAMNDKCSRPKSKAYREKMRRDKLNDKFLELSSILEPGRPPRSDKASILSDAARILEQLKAETEELKMSNDKLQETVKDLKAEKNEFREEKTRLKADKEKLEQQVKAMSMPPAGFMPHPVALHPGAMTAAFAPCNQTLPHKAGVPLPAFPGVPMWQWLPPAVVDTAQDAKLWSPNA